MKSFENVIKKAIISSYDMKYLNIGVFHDEEIAKELGKKEGETDILMYSRKTDDCIFTFLVPREDKPGTKARIMSVIDAAIISFARMSPSVGETVLMLDAFGIKHGVALVPPGTELNQITAITTGTSLESFVIKKNDPIEVMANIEKIDMKREEDPAPIVAIDQAFSVKGVGEIALGFVRAGVLHKHDKLLSVPGNKEVVIRSIQVQDKDVDEAGAGARVGAALRGIESKEIAKGSLLCSEGVAKIQDEIILNFNKNKFYKDDIFSKSCHVGVGLDIVPGVIEVANAGDETAIKVKLDRPVVFIKNDTFVLLDINAQKVHFMGSGKAA